MTNHAMLQTKEQHTLQEVMDQITFPTLLLNGL